MHHALFQKRIIKIAGFFFLFGILLGLLNTFSYEKEILSLSQERNNTLTFLHTFLVNVWLSFLFLFFLNEKKMLFLGFLLHFFRGLFLGLSFGIFLRNIAQVNPFLYIKSFFFEFILFEFVYLLMTSFVITKEEAKKSDFFLILFLWIVLSLGKTILITI